MIDPKRIPEPSFGPDEEGELPLLPEDVTEKPAAWVHVDGNDMTQHPEDQ